MLRLLLRRLPGAPLIVALIALAGVARITYDDRSVDAMVERAKITSEVSMYEIAIMHGDGQAACFHLTEGAKQQLLASAARTGLGHDCIQVGNSMQRYVESLVARAPSPERAEDVRLMIEEPPVELVEIDGDTATARVRGVSDEIISLTRTDVGWKISGFPGLGG